LTPVQDIPSHHSQSRVVRSVTHHWLLSLTATIAIAYLFVKFFAARRRDHVAPPLKPHQAVSVNGNGEKERKTEYQCQSINSYKNSSQSL
jgi:hypothetical protein